MQILLLTQVACKAGIRADTPILYCMPGGYPAMSDAMQLGLALLEHFPVYPPTAHQLATRCVPDTRAFVLLLGLGIGAEFPNLIV
jgi:hypothetical protein